MQVAKQPGRQVVFHQAKPLVEILQVDSTRLSFEERTYQNILSSALASTNETEGISSC